MKKILKSSPPNVLTVFAYKYPKSLWDKKENYFTNYNKGILFKILREKIFSTQGEICAYCECKIVNSTKLRIEHINDKSNYNTSTKWIHNLHLDWNNIVGVCLGGSSPKNPLYPTPKNLSCDAYKENQSVSYKDILNPLQIQAFPNLFKFEKRSGKLQVDEDKCKEANIDIKLVEDTIDNLNLNCDRLMIDRYKVFKAYNIEIAKGIKLKDRDVYKKLAHRWFSQKYPSFFTTRRILLGKHAENYLKENSYNG